MSTQDQFEPAVRATFTPNPTVQALDHIEKIIAIQAKALKRSSWLAFAIGVVSGVLLTLGVLMLVG